MATQQSPHFPNCFYRVSVKGIYVKDDKVLMADDHTNPHRPREWELPGGGLDFGEDIKEALKREVEEEMGLTVTSVSEEPIYIWTVNHGPGRGMEWYWVLILAYRIELKDLNFTPSEECKEIKFFSKEEMQERKHELSAQCQPFVELFSPQDFL